MKVNWHFTSDNLIYILDYRQAAKEELKEGKIELEKLELKEYIDSLEVLTEEQLILLHEMSRIISELQQDLEKMKKDTLEEKCWTLKSRKYRKKYDKSQLLINSL